MIAFAMQVVFLRAEFETLKSSPQTGIWAGRSSRCATNF